MNVVAKCPRCNYVAEFRHTHQTAHGIAETHMAGSERFECTQCNASFGYTHESAHHFKFILDGKEKK